MTAFYFVVDRIGGRDHYYFLELARAQECAGWYGVTCIVEVSTCRLNMHRLGEAVVSSKRH